MQYFPSSCMLSIEEILKKCKPTLKVGKARKFSKETSIKFYLKTTIKPRVSNA